MNIILTILSTVGVSQKPEWLKPFLLEIMEHWYGRKENQANQQKQDPIKMNGNGNKYFMFNP